MNIEITIAPYKCGHSKILASNNTNENNDSESLDEVCEKIANQNCPQCDDK